MDIETIRGYFPQLKEKVFGKPFVYLDNSATSLRPECVIEKWARLAASETSNIHRSVHWFSNLATEEYESARDYVKNWLNASDRSEIVFTSGTTASVNLLASSLERSHVIDRGDRIVIAESEHHSDIVPWQMAAARAGAKIVVWPVEDNGTYKLDYLEKILAGGAKLCCIAQISNVLGQINPVKEIAELCHSHGTLLFVDAAQGIVHCKPDMKDMDCDFYAFSGHKIYAATGTGVLYCRKSIIDTLEPWQGGGEMIDTVRWEKTSYAPAPLRFEAGTPNFTSVPTLVPALELAEKMRADAEENSGKIVRYLFEELGNISGLRIYGTDEATKVPLFSFTVEGAHHEDMALILDKMGIAVRSGEMCAAPLMRKFGVTGMLRASFAPYNTMDEAEYFVSSLKRAVNMLTK